MIMILNNLAEFSAIILACSLAMAGISLIAMIFLTLVAALFKGTI